MEELMKCEKCGTEFPRNSLSVRLQAILAGAVIGAFTGTGIGLVGLFLGALVFASFGAVLGAVIAGFAVTRIGRCPQCGEMVMNWNS